MTPRDKLIEGIKELYRKHLQREADEPGVENYANSGLSLENIEKILLNSFEYAALQRRAKFKETVQSHSSGELLLMGASPKEESNVRALQEAGVTAVLNLESTINYDPSVFEHFENVPLQKSFTLRKDQVLKCLEFIYDNVVVHNRKTFVHSDLGVERAPMIVALFLVAERGISFGIALRIVTSRQQLVSPGRKLLNADLLEYVKSLHGKLGGGAKPSSVAPTDKPFVEAKPLPNFVKISDKFYIGSSVDNQVLSTLKNDGVATIFNVNTENKLDDNKEVNAFRHVHFPLSPKDVSAMLPAVLRSIRKYLRSGKMYLYSEEQGLCIMILETYLSNLEENDVIGISDPGEVRRKLFVAPIQS